MSPDDRTRFDHRGFDSADRGASADRGFDAPDRGLEQQLTVAGREARHTAGGTAPDPLFAAELRERLVAQLETQPVPWWAAWMRGVARAVPVSVAAVLFAVAVVGASQLNLGAPNPTDPPVAATDPPSTIGPVPDGTDNPFPIVPVVTPAPDATANPTATPKPTTAPAPSKPPAEPTPPPPSGPVAMSLSLKSCDGGVVLTWSKYKGIDFNHYTTLRNTSASVPLAYPPQGGAVDFGGTYTTDYTVLSAVDTSGTPYATYYYRTMAFNSEDGVVGASDVLAAQAKPTLGLGTLAVAPDAAGTLFSWTPYGGPGACFTYYKLAYSTTNPNPSYLNGDPYLWAGSTQAQASTVIPDLVSGQTIYVRIQVIRSTALGAFVAAQSDVTTYLVP